MVQEENESLLEKVILENFMLHFFYVSYYFEFFLFFLILKRCDKLREHANLFFQFKL